MTRLITVFALLLVTTFTKGQTAYEKGMQKGLTLMEQDKLEEAVAQFERIATAETKNWLPNYYVALNNTFLAFRNMQDKAKVTAYLKKAQEYQDIINAIDLNNSEILVLQGLIHTANLMLDPMTNGQSLYPIIIEVNAKAVQIAPNNPRAVFHKASFEKGSTEYFGGNTKPMCDKIKQSLELFANFKPETPLHPNWGLNRAKEESAKCK